LASFLNQNHIPDYIKKSFSVEFPRCLAPVMVSLYTNVQNENMNYVFRKAFVVYLGIKMTEGMNKPITSVVLKFYIK
jgi:hypothetical protein